MFRRAVEVSPFPLQLEQLEPTASRFHQVFCQSEPRWYPVRQIWSAKCRWGRGKPGSCPSHSPSSRLLTYKCHPKVFNFDHKLNFFGTRWPQPWGRTRWRTLKAPSSSSKSSSSSLSSMPSSHSRWRNIHQSNLDCLLQAIILLMQEAAVHTKQVSTQLINCGGVLKIINVKAQYLTRTNASTTSPAYAQLAVEFSLLSTMCSATSPTSEQVSKLLESQGWIACIFQAFSSSSVSSWGTWRGAGFSRAFRLQLAHLGDQSWCDGRHLGVTFTGFRHRVESSMRLASALFLKESCLRWYLISQPSCDESEAMWSYFISPPLRSTMSAHGNSPSNLTPPTCKCVQVFRHWVLCAVQVSDWAAHDPEALPKPPPHTGHGVNFILTGT